MVVGWEEKKKVFVNIAFVGKTSINPEKAVPDGSKKVINADTTSFDNLNASQAVTEEAFKAEDVQATVAEAKNLEEATAKLKKVATGSEVVDVPMGEPLFLFSTAVGKTKPVRMF